MAACSLVSQKLEMGANGLTFVVPQFNYEQKSVGNRDTERLERRKARFCMTPVADQGAGPTSVRNQYL